MVDVSTGPWWAGRNDIVKLPVGYMTQSLGSRSFSPELSYIVHFDPSYEHFFNQYFSLKGSVTYSGEFFSETVNKAMDNFTQRYEINPNIYLFNRSAVISLTAGYESINADNKINGTETRLYSYEGQYYGISTLLRLPTQTELFFRYRWNERNYKTPPLMYPILRVDHKDSYTAVLSQGFLKHFFASFAVSYTDNESNADLYSFDKTTYTAMLGFYF